MATRNIDSQVKRLFGFKRMRDNFVYDLYRDFVEYAQIPKRGSGKYVTISRSLARYLLETGLEYYGGKFLLSHTEVRPSDINKLVAAVNNLMVERKVKNSYLIQKERQMLALEVLKVCHEMFQRTLETRA